MVMGQNAKRIKGIFMTERLNLAVEDGIGDMLSALAGGERKRGQYLSDLIRGMAKVTSKPMMDTITMEFALRGLAGQVQALEGRLAVMEARIGTAERETK